MHTLPSNSPLQLVNPEPNSQAADPALYKSLIQLIRREGLDRIAGDFLEIGRIKNKSVVLVRKRTARTH